MFQILNKPEKEKEFERLLQTLLPSIKENLEIFKNEPRNKKLNHIQNYIILFMVLVLHLL